MFEPFPFQLASYDSADWPEWGSAPRGPLVAFDMAHRGEWLDSVIGADPATGTPTIYHVVRCELCIATHAWPLPSFEALARYYRETFYQQEKPAYLERTERDRAWWEACVWEPILAQCIEAQRCPMASGIQLRLLDIGTGPAVGLDVGRRLGLNTSGIEPNRTVMELARKRGHDVFAATLEDFSYNDDRWHIIAAYETLEHHPEPDEFLLRCYDMLEPGGVLALCVPNDYNPLQLEACQRFGLKRYWLAPPQHLYYWTPKTLQLATRRCGFTLVDLRGTYPLERFMVHAGQMYVGDDTIGRKIHQERMDYELGMVAAGRWLRLESEYRVNMHQRIGREIVLIARKESP